MKSKPLVLAVAAHPDDIEFMMAGTLLLLKGKGCDIHYFNIANGCCGSDTLTREEIIQIRESEAKSACDYLGATFYPSLVDDFAIFYTEQLIQKVAAIVRKVRPDILLVPSLQDYMEDHIHAARIAITAAFVRSMPNYRTDPHLRPISEDVAIYHALPYGLRDEMRRNVIPDLIVDISLVIDRKTKILSFHKSQKEWLDKSQGIDSYINNMKEMSREVGQLSGRYTYGEGWQRHSHLGFSSENYDPLFELLDGSIKEMVI